jgi:hypothetical protein
MNELHGIDIYDKSFTSQNICKDLLRMIIIPNVCKKISSVHGEQRDDSSQKTIESKWKQHRNHRCLKTCIINTLKLQVQTKQKD